MSRISAILFPPVLALALISGLGVFATFTNVAYADDPVGGNPGDPGTPVVDDCPNTRCDNQVDDVLACSDYNCTNEGNNCKGCTQYPNDDPLQDDVCGCRYR